jgi:asparagine synthase (glutamine-hydrolysing)
MCGIAGIYNHCTDNHVNPEALVRMGEILHHRGPDDSGHYIHGNVGLAFRRLSIIDTQSGNQPFFADDKNLVLVCNGEVFNHKELRRELALKGYTFRTSCDIEVILALYMEYGLRIFDKLNGQFAMALYDKRRRKLILARDHFGICPLYYTINNRTLVFASEIKSIVEFPGVSRTIDLTGLDQLLTLPGNVGSRTIFSEIKSLPPGSYLELEDGKANVTEYWDLDYPPAESNQTTPLSERDCIDMLDDQIKKSVQLRMASDVPIGFYLSGGLDSSLIGGVMQTLNAKDPLRSFSVVFPEQGNDSINEQYYQRAMANHIDSKHHEVPYNFSKIDELLKKVVYHAECPLKETYNVCSFMLSQFLANEKVKVTLSGEGADELFGGYYGYRFDASNQSLGHEYSSDPFSEEINQRMWGNTQFTYERNEHDYCELKRSIYSEDVNSLYDSFDASNHLEINRYKLGGMHSFHRRSYVDFKIRLGGHLIADHGDRMTSANGVEGRYPFLDTNLIECIKRIPPNFLVNGQTEKGTLKKVARSYVPDQIINRQKFPFTAPGGIDLLKMNSDLVNEYLSYNRIKSHNFFDADAVERLKSRYLQKGFALNIPYDTDLIVFILTFEILLSTFKISSL